MTLPSLHRYLPRLRVTMYSVIFSHMTASHWFSRDCIAIKSCNSFHLVAVIILPVVELENDCLKNVDLKCAIAIVLHNGSTEASVFF